MRVLGRFESAQALAKALGKPVLLLSGVEWYGLAEGELRFSESKVWEALGGPFFVDAAGDKRLLAAPYFLWPGARGEEGKSEEKTASRTEIALPMPTDNECLIACDTRKEMELLYDLTYGDDGMTKRGIMVRGMLSYPEYRGAHRIFALSINERGEMESENT